MARFNLPDIDFISVDAEELENIGVSKFEELTNISLAESDYRRKMLQAVAFVGVLIANHINYSSKMRLSAYATDSYLDHLAVDVPRLQPKASTAIFRFEVNAPEDRIIPAGSRIGIDGIVFSVQEPIPVKTTDTFVDGITKCETPGTIGNGYLPGQITEIIDPDKLPYVSKAYNLTKTSGGLDWEDDDSYAERIRTSKESYSTAGPELAYEYFAKSANQNVIDVKALTPSQDSAIVQIYPLMANGELPTEEEKVQILESCSDRTVRPLTDHVVVLSPIVVNYDLDITYYLPKSTEGTAEASKAVIQFAVDEYVLWQKTKLGRGIEPSELYASIQKNGGKRVSIHPTEYQAIEENEVAIAQNVTVSFGGFIND